MNLPLWLSTAAAWFNWKKNCFSMQYCTRTKWNISPSPSSNVLWLTWSSCNRTLIRFDTLWSFSSRLSLSPLSFCCLLFFLQLFSSHVTYVGHIICNKKRAPLEKSVKIILRLTRDLIAARAMIHATLWSSSQTDTLCWNDRAAAKRASGGEREMRKRAIID